MTSTYLDASALAKLLLDEPDADVVAAVWLQTDQRFASPLTYVETCAALAAATRNRLLTDAQHRIALAEATGYRADLRPVGLTDQITTRAAELAHRRSLKGADAIHLASALALGDPDLVLATWDRRLRDAAIAEGLRVAPATLG